MIAAAAVAKVLRSAHGWGRVTAEAEAMTLVVLVVVRVPALTTAEMVKMELMLMKATVSSMAAAISKARTTGLAVALVDPLAVQPAAAVV